MWTNFKNCYCLLSQGELKTSFENKSVLMWQGSAFVYIFAKIFSQMDSVLMLGMKIKWCIIYMVLQLWVL